MNYRICCGSAWSGRAASWAWVSSRDFNLTTRRMSLRVMRVEVGP